MYLKLSEWCATEVGRETGRRDVRTKRQQQQQQQEQEQQRKAGRDRADRGGKARGDLPDTLPPACFALVSASL
jgi:transcription initiation factor TFIID subunit TAF12